MNDTKLIQWESLPNPREPDRDIYIVSFADKKSRNAWSLSASRELQNFAKREGQKASGIIFKSRGRVFCSGGQLDDYAAMKEKTEGLRVNQEIAFGLKFISKLSATTVALVHGDCFGGGVELISAFDHIITAPDVAFGFWQRKIGLTYGWQGGSRLRHRIGLAKTRKLMLDAATITGREALRIGLVDQLVRGSQLEDSAINYVVQMSLLARSDRPALKTWTAKYENKLLEDLWWGPKHREVLNERKGR